MATKRVVSATDPISRVKRAKKRRQERPKHPRINYEVIEMENKLFEEFYTQQEIISPSEWDSFMSTARLPLPATFRLTSDTRVSHDLADCLTQRYIRSFPTLSTNSEPISPPSPIPWYPDALAWHINNTKKEIRNDPVLAGYHAFLMRETEVGHVSRQEAVSMIPPLFLDIRSHHKVLDLCAAPGSKTTQIIEALHQSHADMLLASPPSEPGEIPSPIPAGFVVANDSDNKRSYLLVHQAKRKKSANVIVTNHDGAIFPNLHLSAADRASGAHLRYDRVLCDVPCSGDGTIRKNPTVWTKWAPHKGNGLHRLQLRLVVRGAELLAVGGRLVYSTCSMNPVENEAVIHTLLELGEGVLQLLDVSSALPGLEKRPGLKSWRVMSNANVWAGGEEIDGNRDGIYPTFFPPVSEQTHPLERCMRVYPHLQNTGGFFIAVIQKEAPLPWMKDNKNRDSQAILSADPPISTESATGSDEPVDKIENRPFSVFGRFSAPSGYKGYKEDPFIFVDRSDELVAELSALYGLPQSFPWENCFARSEGKARNNVYITNSLIAKILATNQANKNVVKMVNAGLRVFCRSDLSVGSPYRLRFSQDGCNLFIDYISKRKIRIHESDLIKMLASESVSLSDFSLEVLNEIRDVSIGPVVFLCNPSADSANNHTSVSATEEPKSPDQLSTEGVIKKHYKCFITSPLIFSGWKANWSARLFVTKEEKQHYQVMLGYELLSDLSLEEKKMSRLVRCQNRATNEPSSSHAPPYDEGIGELSDDNKL